MRKDHQPQQGAHAICLLPDLLNVCMNSFYQAVPAAVISDVKETSRHFVQRVYSASLQLLLASGLNMTPSVLSM